MSRFIFIVIVFLALAQPAVAATYQPPLTGTVTDAFRAPLTKYSSGNRGWEYSVAAGSPVTATADGTVTFSGQVGGTLNVVVKHDDGVLTTYSKLAKLEVSKGQTVKAGQLLGIATTHFFFGARCNGTYIDPARLFTVRVHLVGEGTAASPPAPSAACAAVPTVTPADLIWLKTNLLNTLVHFHV